MRRYTRSFRTRKNVIETSALRDQFLRQLTTEAEGLLKQLTDQFQQNLQAQATQLLQGIVPTTDGPSVPNMSTGEPGSIASIGQILATGARYLVSRPRTSRDMVESSRSVDAESSFRLSQSQAAAEMQAQLLRGEKNN